MIARKIAGNRLYFTDRLFATAARSAIYRITQTRYSRRKSLLVDRLLILAEGGDR